jgi:hypothetical protein
MVLNCRSRSATIPDRHRPTVVAILLRPSQRRCGRYESQYASYAASLMSRRSHSLT